MKNLKPRSPRFGSAEENGCHEVAPGPSVSSDLPLKSASGLFT